MTTDFRQSQRQFTAHIRNPDVNPGPADVEDRRMAIYRDLIYNNIEGFLDSGFPVLREVHSDAEWHQLVRAFIVQHQCHSPYFLEISQEFLSFLQQQTLDNDKPYLVELAHYEWVELALDCSTEKFPDDESFAEGLADKELLDNQQDEQLLDCQLLDKHPVVSPLAWNLSYQFPVHKISKDYQPTEAPTQPTFLVVYRNRADKVGFMESNAATSRLLTLLEGDSSLTGRQALAQLAEEMQAPDPQVILDFGLDLLKKLISLEILAGLH